MGKNKQRVFLVFNTAGFGDLLLCNPLCQNIKQQYPESKVVFVSDKTFSVAAKNQKDVDDVVVYDKKGKHKGLLGFIKFIISFKYKGACCSFITYKNTRNFLIAFLSGSKAIISPEKVYGRMSERHSQLLKRYSGKDVLNLPMVYEPEKISDDKFDFLNEKYIAICPVCENSEKNIPHNVASEVIRELKNYGYKVVFTGVGDYATEYAKSLNLEESDYINLINKTSINELGYILKRGKGLISVDTGTMHLGCACGVPVVGMFYRDNTAETWSPDENIYNSKTLFQENDAKKICEALFALNTDMDRN